MSFLQELEENLKRLENDPNNVAILQDIGVTLYRLEDFHTATKFFQKALEQEPENNILIQRIGDCYFQLGEYNQALVMYQSMIKK